jgi:putative ABC transport system permease protein
MAWSTLADALGISVLVGVLAGVAPAWRGARLSPVEAMRHE